jgi:Fe2+ transport system protein FeoA
LIVRHLAGEGALCQRLRELGLHEEAEVRLIRAGSSVVAQIAATRLCLTRQAATAVLVAPPELAVQTGDVL